MDSLGEVMLPARKPAVRVLLRERVQTTPTIVPEQMERGTPQDDKAHNQLRTASRIPVDTARKACCQRNASRRTKTSGNFSSTSA